MCQDRNIAAIKYGLGLWLMGMLLVLVGCANNQQSHRVEIESVEPAMAQPYKDGIAEGRNALLPTTIEPVVQYGTETIVNKPSKRVYKSDSGGFSLDFVNIAIDEFISVVFNEMVKSNYVLDDSIRGEITVQTRGQVNKNQLLAIVESVLASKSALMIPTDNAYEIIPMAKAKNYSLKPELYSARNIKPGLRMVIIPINYVNPEDLKAILESVAPGAVHLNVDKERRVVVFTGSEQEISNVADAVSIFDVDWLKSKSIALLPVKHSEASVVAKEISKILTSQSSSHNIVLETFDRFNALLVVASKKAEIDAVRGWLDVLDIVVQTADTQLFVYEVQNRKALDLADMLNGVFSEGGAPSGAAKTDSNTASSREVVVSNKPNQPSQPNLSSLGTDRKGRKPLKIVADETNNALVILASRPEYDSILAVIKDLDILPLQVLIEVSIVEVTLTDELSYGLEWYLKHNGIQDKFNSDTTLDLNAGAGIGAIAPGFSFLLNGSGSLVQAVFNTLAAESKLNVISSPSLMALDNHTATIRVGDQQPVQVASGVSSSNEILTQSIEYKSTGVLLSVTPRVNTNGLVTMELNQEVTDVGSIDDATGQRSFLQRNINSTVAVQDGRTIILGGLITENTVATESGVPGLYKLPLIGGLFGKTTNSKVKRELIVLITPKVIYGHENATKLTKEYAKKMELLKSSLDIGE
jgi:general secretion pathway protein D